MSIPQTHMAGDIAAMCGDTESVEVRGSDTWGRIARGRRSRGQGSKPRWPSLPPAIHPVLLPTREGAKQRPPRGLELDPGVPDPPAVDPRLLLHVGLRLWRLAPLAQRMEVALPVRSGCGRRSRRRRDGKGGRSARRLGAARGAAPGCPRTSFVCRNDKNRHP
jgi:hypothetical protein